ncbi:MAG TPA: TRAM domain-containing protein, partial [Candidatus Saccharimonadales bacterium]|nr:TRAM domain-containing protein [Candidatus Saccharimonadales bacterium]
LAELQNIADSDDAMRRGRGRRGLEMLNAIRQTSGIELEIIEDDLVDITEVDAKLVGLAKKLGTDILTTDYNLNRVAQIEGVRVLNINELSNAIRPVVLPGEEMLVKIVQAGKERGQGVGYLPDGTMIVVDNGDKLIGQEVPTEVTRVFQTVAGKMIFASPKKPAQQRGGNREPASERTAAAKASLKSTAGHPAEAAAATEQAAANNNSKPPSRRADQSGAAAPSSTETSPAAGAAIDLGSAAGSYDRSFGSKPDSNASKFKADRQQGRQSQPSRRNNQRPPSVKSIEDSLIRHNSSRP